MTVEWYPTAYCVKCRKSGVAVVSPELVANSKGVPLLIGNCAVCTKSVRRFVKKLFVGDLIASGKISTKLSPETIAGFAQAKVPAPRKPKVVRPKKEKKVKEAKPKAEIKKTRKHQKAAVTAEAVAVAAVAAN